MRFRSKKNLSVQQKAESEQIAVDVSLWLGDFNFIEGILQEQTTYLFRSMKFDSSNPRKAAEKARLKLGPEDSDCIPDICDLLQKAGIKILLTESRLESFFGLSVSAEDGGPAIAVNISKSIPVERQIFSAAHELGHLLMHTDSYDSSRKEIIKSQEREADCFAGHFLMPQKHFETVWDESSGLNWIDTVLYVKRRFRVSYKTVLRRLVDMNVVDNLIYEKFLDAYEAKHGKRLHFKEEPPYAPSGNNEEPDRLSRLDFIEDRLERLVRKALDKEEIGVSRAAEILNIKTWEMRERIREWMMFG
jgi:Zn-dependent peptidase ImmA (M78 family)